MKNATKVGMHGDGDGLWLRVQKGGTKSWAFRFMLQGRAREMGLGPYPLVTLAQARQAAVIARQTLQKGEDPLAVKQRRKAPEVTVKEAALAYLGAHEKSFVGRHRLNWERSMTAYVYPVLGKLSVGLVEVEDVMKVLDPLWKRIPDTASRVRGRIESVLDYATVRGWRKGDNPARWKGHLSNLLPAKDKIIRVRHFPALPWKDVGKFVGELRAQETVSALALEFLVLTVPRTSELLHATWEEINLPERLWVIPGDRMKEDIGHRIPLSNQALEILPKVRISKYIFPGRGKDRPMGHSTLTELLERMGYGHITIHGFRSTFRDWVADATRHEGLVAEAALAHKLSDKVEAAYQRSDLLDKRRVLMQDWADFILRN